MRKARAIIQDESGSILVETALSLVLLLMTIFGIVYFSEALYAYVFVSYAAQQGTRYAIVRGASTSATCTSATTLNCNATSANITSYVQNLATPGITASSIVVSPTWPGVAVNGSTTACNPPNSQGCLVRVQVSYAFSSLLPFLSSSILKLAGTSQEVIQH